MIIMKRIYAGMIAFLFLLSPAAAAAENTGLSEISLDNIEGFTDTSTVSASME